MQQQKKPIGHISKWGKMTPAWAVDTHNIISRVNLAGQPQRYWPTGEDVII